MCNKEGKAFCPQKDDQDEEVCSASEQLKQGGYKHNNIFSGAGFMFRVGKISIEDDSEGRLFDQQSGNTDN